jgi:hypothetical protein
MQLPVSSDVEQKPACPNPWFKNFLSTIQNHKLYWIVTQTVPVPVEHCNSSEADSRRFIEEENQEEVEEEEGEKEEEEEEEENEDEGRKRRKRKTRGRGGEKGRGEKEEEVEEEGKRKRRKRKRMRRKRRRKRSSSSNNNKMRVLQSKCPYCIPVQQRILATCSDQDAGWTGTFLASTASRLARDPPSRPSNGYSSRAYSVLLPPSLPTMKHTLSYTFAPTYVFIA